MLPCPYEFERENASIHNNKVYCAFDCAQAMSLLEDRVKHVEYGWTVNCASG